VLFLYAGGRGECMCQLLEAVEVVLCVLQVMQMMRYVLLILDVLEGVCCMPLHILEVVEGVCCVPERYARCSPFAGGAGGDALCAALNTGGCGDRTPCAGPAGSCVPCD